MKSNSRWIKNTLYSLVVFIIFIVALEITLRTTHKYNATVAWSKSDPLIGYRYVPNQTYWYHNYENDRPITGKINNFGWRDKDWTLRKPPNTYRIAVLGDSFVEAFQVEEDQTFLALTEEDLREQFHIPAQLMNFGRSGFGQAEEFLVLKNDVSPFAPDMVLIFFMPETDMDDISEETAPNLMRPFYNVSQNGDLMLNNEFSQTVQFKIASMARFLNRHFALTSLLIERYKSLFEIKLSQSIQEAKATEIKTPFQMEGPLSLCTARPQNVYRRNYNLNKLLIKEMAKYCQEKGIRLMLVCAETDAYLPQVEKIDRGIDPTFNPNFFEEDLKYYAKSLGIEYFGLQKLFRKEYEKNNLSLRWYHWNYEGHRVIAQALTNKLASIIQPNKKDGRP